MCLFSIKSAGGQVVLSQIHVFARMKALQALAKLIEPEFWICLSHSIPTPAGVRNPQSSPMGTPSQENSQHSPSMKEGECLLICAGQASACDILPKIGNIPLAPH